MWSLNFGVYRALVGWWLTVIACSSINLAIVLREIWGKR